MTKPVVQWGVRHGGREIPTLTGSTLPVSVTTYLSEEAARNACDPASDDILVCRDVLYEDADSGEWAELEILKPVYRDPDTHEHGDVCDNPFPHVGWDLAFGARLTVSAMPGGGNSITLNISDDVRREGGLKRSVSESQLNTFAAAIAAITGSDITATMATAAHVSETAAQIADITSQIGALIKQQGDVEAHRITAQRAQRDLDLFNQLLPKETRVLHWENGRFNKIPTPATILGPAWRSENGNIWVAITDHPDGVPVADLTIDWR